jgi:cell division septum initiation protein DivIVA
MSTDLPGYPSLLAVYPAKAIDDLYAELRAEIEQLESEVSATTSAAVAAEQQLDDLEPIDPQVAERVVSRTQRILQALTEDAGRELDELLRDARRVAAQRVGEAAADGERRIEQARADVDTALAGKGTEVMVLEPDHAVEPVHAVEPDHAVEPAHDQFWAEEQAANRSWTRKLPVAWIAQLIGAVCVLFLLLVRGL